MGFRDALARGTTRISGYKFYMEERPPKEGAVILGAPHTSNWDFAAMLMIAWQAGIPLRWLGKSQAFKGPLGFVPRLFGGIPVDRDAPGGMAAALAKELSTTPGAMLIIAPEGTRSKRDKWKSGFYRIARDAGLPLVPGYIDSATKTIGLGAPLYLSGDPGADMDLLREFYKGKVGVRPGLESDIRISLEEPELGSSNE